MSGLVKGKKYDWKDSNMALFGSDTEKQVKKESAETEPAWQGSGQEVGLQIWRIVKFQVEHWPKEDYGSFFTGDSYIILNTYKEEDGDELKYDVHFWIGKYSTQDEYGTAAYKTVELDTFHDDKAVQHREVQGHESETFRSYFESLSYMKGGADSGFRHVTPEEYTPRLFKCCKKNRVIELNEVKRSQSMLTDDDVFILDMGLDIYQWNGPSCSPDEKFAAARKVNELKGERGGKPEVHILEDGLKSGPFWSALEGDDDDDDDDQDVEGEGDPVLLKVSDADGSLDMEIVVEGSFTSDLLSTDDVFVIDTRKAVFVWVGAGASIDERKNGIGYAHSYLRGKPYSFAPITVVAEGKENKEFEVQLAGCA